jgi:hypothetical protein
MGVNADTYIMLNPPEKWRKVNGNIRKEELAASRPKNSKATRRGHVQPTIGNAFQRNSRRHACDIAAKVRSAWTSSVRLKDCQQSAGKSCVRRRGCGSLPIGKNALLENVPGRKEASGQHGAVGRPEAGKLIGGNAAPTSWCV